MVLTIASLAKVRTGSFWRLSKTRTCLLVLPTNTRFLSAGLNCTACRKPVAANVLRAATHDRTHDTTRPHTRHDTWRAQGTVA
jgi:hypothetical protein